MGRLLGVADGTGTLHCIALHRAKKFSQTVNLDDDEGMEIEVLLIELHCMHIVCMYCTLYMLI